MSTPAEKSPVPAVPLRGIAGRLAATFIDSKLTPIAIIASLILGLFAVYALPREEEPQINVPMIDVFTSLPGAEPAEVENRLTRPLEKLLWEIPAIEYVYATSSPGQSLLIARFQVGTNPDTALTRVQQNLAAHADRIPPNVAPPLRKPRTIDDVPILALTLHSATQDHFTLRRLAAQLDDTLKSVPGVAETTLIGGQPRTLRVQLDPAALTAYGLTPLQVSQTLAAANTQSLTGFRPFANQEILLETGAFFRDADDAANTIIASRDARPIRLRDVARVIDGPSDPINYVLHGQRSVGSAGLPSGSVSDLTAAVTLTFAKRPGVNATTLVDTLLARVDTLRGSLLPADVELTITRDYGHTAAEKSNELLLHMGIAVFGVALLILFFLGFRESLVVLLAIPTTLALTLLVFYLYGYTLNRITLFALIFSIGILVDDAIVVVENIVRHHRLAHNQHRSLLAITLDAVDEVGNPTILATWAVIAAILPMAFVGGLMGPYMRPIPIGSTAAMVFSLLIAFTITPWAAFHVLRRHLPKPGSASSASSHDQAPSDFFTRLYHRVMDPLLDRARWRWIFLFGIVALLVLATALVPLGAVKVKMLPFDNKSELQLILNAPEGTTLEQTTRIAQEIAAAISTEPEVRDFQIYAGTSAPFNFNGLVRHYFLRRGANVADIQVNLVNKSERSAQSHDIARRIRPRAAAIAAKYGADLAVAEVPPGPPVLQSLVAEIYGPSDSARLALATRVRELFTTTPGVVDLDWYVEAPQPKVRYVVDQAKAAAHGISIATINQTLQLAAQGQPIGLLHAPAEREDVPLVLEIPDTHKNSPADFLALNLRSDANPAAPLVPLSELVQIERTTGPRNLYRKNLKPVIYITADVAGVVESPAYALLDINARLSEIDARDFGGRSRELAVFHLNQPFDDQEPSLKWDGEWHITLEVFRDLGLAFAAVLVLIAMLMVGWFRSYVTPLVVMAAIPFSLIGILPAHWAMGAFFTATSMIGFMAGAGIVVRNSIILVDFIELRRRDGLSLRDAVVEAGAVRFRPMLLTALAVVVGASVILADPIFQGLAISLMFGEIASLLISRMAVPVLYYMANKNQAALPAAPVAPTSHS